jgi:hypothetical protein
MKIFALDIDIDGTHFSAGTVVLNELNSIENSIIRIDTNSGGTISPVLDSSASVIRKSLSTIHERLSGIGVEIPGPFGYENSLSEICYLSMYKALFGCTSVMRCLRVWRIFLPTTYDL